MDGRKAGAPPARRLSGVEQAANLAGVPSGVEQAAELAGDTDSKAGEADKINERAAELAADVKSEAASAAEQQKGRAAEQVDRVADSAYRTADALRNSQQGWLADMVERGADELTDFAGRLRGNDLQGLLQQIEAFARRQPALFAGASIAAGFAIARMARIATDQATGTHHTSMGKTFRQPAKPEQDQPWQERTETTYPGTMYHG
jgi:hypothetical protein